MSCEIDKQAGILRIRGEMTIYNAAGLKDALFAALEAEPGACTFDLADVSEFDTAGLQLILMSRRACEAAGKSWALRNPSDIVRETFGLLQLRDFCVSTPGAAV